MLAIYMSSLQIRRYLENKDTSSSSTREFHQSPRDLYPSFSYCFEDRDGGLYDKRNFTEHTGLTREDYQKVLMGEQDFLQKESDTKVPSILEMDVDAVTLQLGYIFSYMESHFLNNSVEQTARSMGFYGSLMDFPLMYKSYQDPIRLCFTRKSVFEKGIVRQADYLATASVKVLIERMNMKTKLLLYIHQDGQLIRAVKNLPLYSYYLKKDLWPIVPVDRYLLLNIVRVSMVLKRADSNDPCNPELDNDDYEFRNRIVHRIGCIPPYWKQFQYEASDFGQCNTSAELKEMFNLITNEQHFLDTYLPPCNKMSVVTTLSMDGSLGKGKGNGVEIWYMDKTYEETINRRDFGFETFWSSIGGFTGIFLGFSLLQIPDLVVNFISKANKPKKNKRSSKPR